MLLLFKEKDKNDFEKFKKVIKKTPTVLSTMPGHLTGTKLLENEEIELLVT